MTQTDAQLDMRIEGTTARLYTVQNIADTTDATATEILAIPIPEDAFAVVILVGNGTRDDYSDSLVYTETTHWRRASGGNVTAGASATDLFLSEDSSGSPTILTLADTVAQTVSVVVTGIAAQNWYWHVTATVIIRTL